MTLYAESSAVLAWLLGERSGEAVRDILSRADLVIASDLTLIECDRALIRAGRPAARRKAGGADRRGRLSSAAATWHMLRMHSDVAERARQPFPVEPVRTLDALHLASALCARVAVSGLAVLALDERIRSNAQELGFPLLPS